MYTYNVTNFVCHYMTEITSFTHGDMRPLDHSNISPTTEVNVEIVIIVYDDDWDWLTNKMLSIEFSNCSAEGVIWPP